MTARRTYATAEDEQLLVWSMDGDRGAFGEIVERYGTRALRVAFRVLQDRAAAEDVAQEALVRIWQHAGRFDPKQARFSTWLHRIVVNLAIDHQRKKVPERLDDTIEFVDPAAGPERVLADDQRRKLTWDALSELPARQRAAVVLTYQEGLGGTLAAETLGITPKALERLLSRARAYLRQRLVDLI